MARTPPEVGAVVYNKLWWRDQLVRCPGCSAFIHVSHTHCDRCKTTFVPVAPGYVQIVGVREDAP